MNEVKWEILTCQEASILSRQTKIDCGAPAVAIIWHNKDRRGYPMCEGCAAHNVKNRGGVLLTAKEGIVI